MCGLWDNPRTVTSPSPIRWDMNGKPTFFENKRSFISCHQTTPESMAEGFIVCIRKMGFDEKPENN
jgi:hypothetical protein